VGRLFRVPLERIPIRSSDPIAEESFEFIGMEHVPKTCSNEGSKASHMSRTPVLKSSFLLGFDEIEQACERMARTASDGYPPYNIERIAGRGSKAARLRITLAVAGFTADRLQITVEKGRLAIRGLAKDEKERVRLHRGIAARQFQRIFRFAEALEVAEATLQDGLLSVELIRPEPEPNFQNVETNVRD